MLAKVGATQEKAMEMLSTLLTGMGVFFFFLVTRGVRASLRAPQLIPGSTEHPASPVDK